MASLPRIAVSDDSTPRAMVFSVFPISMRATNAYGRQFGSMAVTPMMLLAFTADCTLLFPSG